MEICIYGLAFAKFFPQSFVVIYDTIADRVVRKDKDTLLSMSTRLYYVCWTNNNRALNGFGNVDFSRRWREQNSKLLTRSHGDRNIFQRLLKEREKERERVSKCLLESTTLLTALNSTFRVGSRKGVSSHWIRDFSRRRFLVHLILPFLWFSCLFFPFSLTDIIRMELLR